MGGGGGRSETRHESEGAARVGVRSNHEEGKSAEKAKATREADRRGISDHCGCVADADDKQCGGAGADEEK